MAFFSARQRPELGTDIGVEGKDRQSAGYDFAPPQRPKDDGGAGARRSNEHGLENVVAAVMLQPSCCTSSTPPSSVMNARRFTRSPRRRSAGAAKAHQGRAPLRS